MAASLRPSPAPQPVFRPPALDQRAADAVRGAGPTIQDQPPTQPEAQQEPTSGPGGIRFGLGTEAFEQRGEPGDGFLGFGPLVRGAQNFVADAAFGDTGIFQAVREFFEPEPAREQPIFGGTGIGEGLQSAVDLIGNFVLPGTAHLVGQQERGQAAREARATERAGGGGGEPTAVWNPITGQYEFGGLSQSEVTEMAGGQGPFTFLEWLDELSQASDPRDFFTTGNFAGVPGFGGGGGGGFGGFNLGGGGFDPADPRYWLDAARWLIG